MYLVLPVLVTYLLLLLPSNVVAKKRTDPKHPPKDAILLSSVHSLTFRANRQTTSRRGPPVPQLSCVGSPEVCALFKPEVIRCNNEGSSYGKEDVEWACKADLPEEFKFGATDVVCEGYESPDDDFVLRGSCGVEYNLLLTDKGERKFGSSKSYKTGKGYASERKAGRDDTPSAIGKVIFLAIFGIVVFLIVRSFIQSWRRNPPRLGNGGGRPPWHGGGGGGGGNDDPPPPYDDDLSHPPRKPTTSTRNSTTNPSRQAQSNANQGWRPGPWTAAAAGAAAGYMMGNRSNNTRTRQEAQQRPIGGLFGGDAGPSNWNTGPSGGSAPSFSSSPRHESTGFGGTRRR